MSRLDNILEKWNMNNVPDFKIELEEVMHQARLDEKERHTEVETIKDFLTWLPNAYRYDHSSCAAEVLADVEEEAQKYIAQLNGGGEEEISLCPICNCMTHTVSGEFEEQCGKCGGDKAVPTAELGELEK